VVRETAPGRKSFTEDRDMMRYMGLVFMAAMDGTGPWEGKGSHGGP
jgi:hypothetical protein